MSIEAMKQALEALEFAAGLISSITKGCQCQICLAHKALRQAIAEAKKQEPVHAIYIPQERVDETPKCKDDPDAPHGFDRNASHSADRYVCECENWEPDNAA